MILRKFIILSLVALLYSIPLRAQINTIELLEKEITKNNDALQYEKSIQVVTEFIADERRSHYEKYNAYILKSYIYKRLFNYVKTIHTLDLALAEGLKSQKVEEIKNTINSEKAFVYFDTRQYEKASRLMQELASENYKYLRLDSKAWIIMQEGYLLMLNKKYMAAEQKLDASLQIIKSSCPRNLPNIYGKKIELYNAMKLYEKRDKAFDEGMKIAKQYKILKYEMYLYEVMGNQFQNNNDYKNASEAQQKHDSLLSIYDSSNNNGKIQIIEKKIDDEKKEIERYQERNVNFFLIGLIFILLILLVATLYLYKTNKQKRILVEEENQRIHNKIELLTKAIDDKGNSKLELSKFDLTERQLEIIELIKQGKSNKEIAGKLFISENTVKYHLKIIYEILDIENRTELTK